MIAPDSSVTIAAAAPWHVAHDAAVAALAAGEPSLIAHVAFETTAALSRMPEGHRLAPAVVMEWLEIRFRSRWLALPAVATRRALRQQKQQYAWTDGDRRHDGDRAGWLPIHAALDTDPLARVDTVRSFIALLGRGCGGCGPQRARRPVSRCEEPCDALSAPHAS